MRGASLRPKTAHPRGTIRFLQAQTIAGQSQKISGIQDIMHLKNSRKRLPPNSSKWPKELEIEGASTLRRQDIMFAILKEVAEDGEESWGSARSKC